MQAVQMIRLRKLLAVTLSLVLALTMFGAPVAFAEEADSPAEVVTEPDAEAQDAATSADDSEDSADDEVADASETPEAVAQPAKSGKSKPGVLSDVSWWNDSDAPQNFTISTDQQLMGLAVQVNSGEDSFAGDTITLGSNINFDSSQVEKLKPIGTKANPFEGTFIGTGFDINNLTLDLSANRSTYVGLFGYAGSHSLIQNVTITNTAITINSANQIRYVGSIAGYSEGKIEGCLSYANITLTSTMKADSKTPGMIRTVGGIAGQATDDITNCKFVGSINLNCASNAIETMGSIAGEVGGIVGIFGDQSKLAKTPTISGCANGDSSPNTGNMSFNINGAGGKDRFGTEIFARSQAVGGIAGYSMGNIEQCVNEGILYTGVKTTSNMAATVDLLPTTIAKPESGFGASATGGIVGSLRDNFFDDIAPQSAEMTIAGNPPYNYFRKNGGKAAGAVAIPPTVKVTDCINKSIVIGLTAVGGIVGSSTGWSEIEGCVNRGDIMGTRWNKPFAAGIGGNVSSDIRYCYNRGAIYSTAGAGYYCAGIAGGLVSDNTTATVANERVTEPLLTGCYTTGSIILNDAGYRSGILVGENTGLIQNNAFIPSLTPDGKIVDTNSGTLKDTVESSQFPDTNATAIAAAATSIKGSKPIARLNTYAAGKGKWEMIYVKDAGNVNEGYPVLVRVGGIPANIAKMSLASAASLSGTSTVTENAKYSAALDPSPKVTITGLYQNADFFVVPQSGTAGNNVGDTEYAAQVKGMGQYSGDNGTVNYKIIQAPISECTVQAEPVVFNWGVQRPTKDKVNLYDEAGNIVAKTQYSVSDEYDPSKGTKAYDIDPDPNHTEWGYFDYKNSHGRYYYYSVVVKAESGANYEGDTTQMAWRIKSASMVAQRPKTDPKYNELSPESVTYGKTYFDINQNGKIEANEKFDTLKGTDDETGASIKIPYTGKLIYPRVESAMYKGKSLREATNYDYFERPLDFDFKYIYGNPNPEVDDGINSQPINVSKPGKPEAMTLRFTSGSNFDNYNNVFYQIVPAAITSAKVTVADQPTTGKALKPKPVLTFNGKTMKEGTDYTITTSGYKNNKDIGKAKFNFTITGKGNFSGTISKTGQTFNVVPKKNSISKLTVGKKQLKVAIKKVAKSQKITGHHIRYRVKGTTAWKQKTLSAKKTSLVIKGLKKGKIYEVQTRPVKGKYYAPWSATKTSKKLK